MSDINHGQLKISQFLDRLNTSNRQESMAFLQVVSHGTGAKRGADNRPGSFEAQQERKQKNESNSQKPITDLQHGTQCKIKVSLSRSGYLHLFDLGTSGTCKKLFPMEGETNYFYADKSIILPSEYPDDCIKVGLSSAGENKGCENRFLIIFTEQPQPLDVKDLDSSLIDRPAALGFRGDSSPFDEDFCFDETDLLDHLSGQVWFYDLIRFTIS